MSNELIIANKEDLVNIADAIREKAGVEDTFAFPDAFAEAISAIETGGDIKMTTGSFTFTEDKDVTHPNYYLVEHGLGVTPEIVIIMQEDNYPTFMQNAFIGYCTYKYWMLGIYGAGGSSTETKAGYFSISSTFTTNTFEVGKVGSTASCYIQANKKFTWFAFAGVTS